MNMSLIRLPWWIYAVVGLWRRKKGRYDKKTLASFFLAWRKQPSAVNLMAYLGFRRDLGLTAPMRLLRGCVGHIPGRAVSMSADHSLQRRAYNGLYESGGARQLDPISVDVLKNFSECSPAIAAVLKKRDETISAKESVLSVLQSQQNAWRDMFSGYLEENRNNICVVGNAATVESSEIGHVVDSYGVVFRFNHFSASNSSVNLQTIEQLDIGSRLDVWVCAPNLQPPYPIELDSVEWVVISGPDVRYQLADWSNIIPLLNAGKRVLTVPLHIWRSLVHELEAPPSAGLVCLAWLIEILGTPVGIKAAGFQREEVSEKRYHFALRQHKPSPRHNWAGERVLLCRWEKEGLVFLD